MRKPRLILFVLCCAASFGPLVGTSAAQAIANGSFEDPAPLPNSSSVGPWSYGPVPGWQLSGQGGLWQPSTASYPTLPDGKQVLWLNAGSVTKDLGAPGQANWSYSVLFSVAQRGGGFPTNLFTASMNVGGGVFCTTSGSNSLVPPGGFLAFTLKCQMGGVPTTGNLALTISSAGPQIVFDNIILISSPPAAPPVLTMISLNVKVLLCTVCDGTDDAPFNGQAVIAQTGGPTQTIDIPSGLVSINSGWDFGQPDPLEFTFTLNAAGKQVGQVTQKIYKVLMPTVTGSITGLVRIDAKTFLLRGIQEAFGQ